MPDSGPLPRKGRAAAENTPNRFERLHLAPDPEDPAAEAARPLPTEILRDTSRSAVSRNDSPDLPFRWSLNPYRGCEHGCPYCLDGETPILLADGTTRPLAELRVGDEIYGTVRQGHYRRFTRTRVLAHWATRKLAYRITLADGTELVASGDHRFLTERGWKYVTGTTSGGARRPHLTFNNKLMGFGALPQRRPASDPFRAGYLAGMIRGDGHIGHYEYTREGRSHGNQPRFRLALADHEGLNRTAAYLSRMAVPTRGFEFSAPSNTRMGLHGIRVSAERHVRRIEELIAWPIAPCFEWRRGFLAGAFDAEGSHGSVIRFSNADGEYLHHVRAGLAQMGFSSVEDLPHQAANVLVRVLRLQGGLRERLRFLQVCDPAISKKRSIEGHAVKTTADLRIDSIEPLAGERELFDITTGTGDFIANGVIAHNCYARPSHEYLGFSAGLDFETRIVAKPDLPHLLAKTFQKPSWQPETVVVSGNTDPYQPVERKLELTRRCLEVFVRHRNPVGLITKNALVLRDLDLLRELAALDLVHVTVSLTTLRDEIAGPMEPRASRPSRRLHAIERLAEAGVPVGVNAAPLIPGLTDEELPAILAAAAGAGATRAGYIVVRLPGPVEPIFTAWLRCTFPDRADRVLARLGDIRGGRINEARFGHRMRGEGPWADLLRQLFRTACQKHGLSARYPPLATQHFRRLPGGQMGLF